MGWATKAKEQMFLESIPQNVLINIFIFINYLFYLRLIIFVVSHGEKTCSEKQHQMTALTELFSLHAVHKE